MRRCILPLALLLIHWSAFAQYDPLHPPNTFKSSDNPLYWKNRQPEAGYWQQDVHYRIAASLNENTDIITGKMELSYWNNSPDTLHEVFFHLYQNAYQPDSYMERLSGSQGEKNHFKSFENGGKGTQVLSMTVNGQQAELHLDNTILRVVPAKAILPNSRTEFKIDFKTYFGHDQNGRMKAYGTKGHRHYNGVHWYPRMSVYDRKFGWTTDQHLGHEFYGDFGTFDVALTLSSNFIVGATGMLQNRNQVLPDELRKKLDITNFADKPWGEAASVIIPYDSTAHKTWAYHAENVHDFAFTADPDYRIGEAEWNGIKCYALALESHASGWQNAADYAAKTIRTFSEGIGMYQYHKMIVSDARDGMEYPMLTLDGGRDPEYRGLLVHEIGHNWFFGQVGNNETYRAPLDEGFTEFLTAYGLRAIEGDTELIEKPKNWYRRLFTKPRLHIDNEVYFGYMRSAVRYLDPPLNTHSDMFESDYYDGYGQVYFKTATMLYNLEYVLGDTLFEQSMKHYFEQWRFCHPYFNDFRNSVIRFTHVDLNWFFDQWLETDKHVDYAIDRVRRSDKQGSYIIRFRRKGRMQMPIDFNVIDRNDSVHCFHIPNTWFVKKTPATVLPKWTGFGKLNRSYDAEVNIPAGIRQVIIDTTSRLADIYMLDNIRSASVSIDADHQVYNRPDWRKYELAARPDIWYNGFDGFKFGLHVSGGHFNTNHVFSAYIWANSGFLQWDLPSNVRHDQFMPVSFLFDYHTSLARYWKNSNISLSARVLDGLYNYEVGLSKQNRKRNNTYRIFFRSLYRQDTRDMAYLLNRHTWNVDRWNNSFNAEFEHDYSYPAGDGILKIALRSSSLGSDYDYHLLKFEAVNHTKLWRLVLNTRVFGQLGTGSDWAPESSLYIDKADPEEMMYNKYTRSAGIFPSDWATYREVGNHLHYGGGLNLRGYTGYLSPEKYPDGVVLAYAGNTGAAINAELEFDGIFGLSPKFTRNWLDIDMYLFADVGSINKNPTGAKLAMALPRADAGLGMTLTIKQWGPLEMVRPLTLRFDMPLFLSRAPALDPHPWGFRWLVGISKAF